MENNLLKKFASFLRETGENEEAEKIENILKGIEDFVEEIENEEEIIPDSNKDGVITVADCRFMVCAILPDNNVYPVNIDSDDVADFIVSINKFEVIDQPIGTMVPKTAFQTNSTTSTKNKYLD